MTSSTTVVVLSRTPGDWLQPCLDSIVGQAGEVILVDNGSPAAEAAAIGRRCGVRVLRSPDNKGFAGGVNLALRHVRTDHVALLNDDAVAGPGWLAQATSVLAEPDVAAVTPKVRMSGAYREVQLGDGPLDASGDRRILGRRLASVTVDGVDVLDALIGSGVHESETDPADVLGHWRWTAPGHPFYVPVGARGAEVLVNGDPAPEGSICRILNKAGSYLRTDGQLGDHGWGSPDDGRWDAPGERFNASGTAIVLRMDTVRRLGGLADPFFAYYEDSDWGWRARLAGMRILYDPRSVVDHRVSATSGGLESSWVRHLAARNRLLCLVRNAPRWVAAAAIHRRWQEGPGDGVRRDVMRLLPWALWSRQRLERHWTVPPEQVWNEWAGRDLTWDDGPARP